MRTDMSTASTAHARRAPRLGPDQRIAAHITRTGRFTHVDPSRGRPLPGWVRWFGFAGWLTFCAETLRRARRAAKSGA